MAYEYLKDELEFENAVKKATEEALKKIPGLKEPKVSGNPEDQTHYKNSVIQPIILMQLTLTPEEFIGFLKGNIIKYTMRAGKKAGESVDKDTEKALAYKKLLERFTGKQPIDF